MRIIYEPTGEAKEYAELAVNIYNGCPHSCLYCYCPDLPCCNKEMYHIDTKVFEQFSLDNIQKDAKLLLANGCTLPIHLSFIGDIYQPLDMKLEHTRGAIKVLNGEGLAVQLLTKGGLKSTRDFDLLKRNPNNCYGTTLTLLNDDESLHWEPNAPLPLERIEALKIAHSEGIKTWVSLEPVINPDATCKLIDLTHEFVDHYKIGILNYHPHVKTINWSKFKSKVVDVLERYGTNYYLKESLRNIVSEKVIRSIGKNSTKILLDSGAFSARKAGKKIDIDEYMRFVKEYGDLFHRYFNLDVINEDLTSQQKGEHSLKNYKTMRDKELNPVPVFHHGSDLSILDYYKKHSHSDYIGLGNISDKDEERIPFLEYMFTNHFSNCSVHGFGVASFDLLTRKKYTWASVDSTKYLKEASFGKIMVPYYDGNKFLYADDRCDTFFVTERSAQEYDKKERHYKYVRKADKEIIERYLKEECGTTIEALEKFKQRLRVNAMFYQKLEAQLQYPIYLSVTITNKTQCEVVIELKVKHVLVSYFFFMNDHNRFFKFYVEYMK